VCGFASIAYASKVTLTGDAVLTSSEIEFNFLLSAGLILAAMVFDVLDGYAARLSRTTSEFGGQLDSLCDAISFGAAPAFLLLRLGQEWSSHVVVAKAIAVIAAFYMACAVLRLARFNIENSPENATNHKRFKGLPSPAAAGCIVSLIILRADTTIGDMMGLNAHAVGNFVSVWAPIGAFVAGLLMVSRFPYTHFTRQLLRGRRQFRFVVQAVVILTIVALTPNLALFLLFWTYALLGPVRYLVAHARRHAVPEHTPGLH
jgi:CDP-diacylglycerol--serine O-phosphatidyltransferase